MGLPALPAGFGSTIDLGLGAPSTAISGAYGSPITNEGWTGPFAVGSGADARQTNNLPVTNNQSQPPLPQGQGGNGLASLASVFNPSNMVTALLFMVALSFAKKKGLL